MEIETYPLEVQDRPIDQLVVCEACVTHGKMMFNREPERYAHYQRTHEAAVEAAELHDSVLALFLDYHSPATAEDVRQEVFQSYFEQRRIHQDRMQSLSHREELLYRMYVNPLAPQPGFKLGRDELGIFSYVIDRLPTPDPVLMRNSEKRKIAIDVFKKRLERLMQSAQDISRARLQCYDSVRRSLVMLEVPELPGIKVDFPSVLFIEADALDYVIENHSNTWDRFATSIDHIIVLDVGR